MRQTPRSLEAGAGTVVAISLMATVASMTFVFAQVTEHFVSQSKLDALAENVAIAGADSLRGLTTGSPCDTASELVLSASARIISCSIIDTDLLIELEKGELTSKARAGEPKLEEN